MRLTDRSNLITADDALIKEQQRVADVLNLVKKKKLKIGDKVTTIFMNKSVTGIIGQKSYFGGKAPNPPELVVKFANLGLPITKDVKKLKSIKADDIPATLIIKQLLRKRGFTVRIFEPEELPPVEDAEIYEMVMASRGHLLVTVVVYPKDQLWLEVGAYRKINLRKDNWPNLIIQLKSTKPINRLRMIRLVENLLDVSDVLPYLLSTLIQMNKSLHWLKFTRRSR